MKSNLLKAKMTERGFSQRALASKMKISPTTLNLKLAGKRPFSLDEAEKICVVLGINDPLDKVKIFLP